MTVCQDEDNKMFVLLVLSKAKSVPRDAVIDAPKLKACQYKKR